MKLHAGLTVTLQIPGFDQVELIEELGSGGDGHVWKVKPLSPGKEDFYVLKSICLNPEMNAEQRADHIRRIRREASVFVDSEYIIKCLGLCEAEPDHFFLLFPYEPGNNLEQWIRENRDRPLSDKKALFLKILDGVQALHQAQIIHRDLKPKNMLVVIPEETPRIFDFGLAKFRNRESVTEVGTIAGTDAYIAPEVFGWGGIKAVDERCDIYALGIILYEFIVGKNPWRANGWDFGEFARFLRQEERGGISRNDNILDIDKKFSSEVEYVAEAIRQSTMFEPTRRFQSVEQMRQVLQGLRISTRPKRLLDSLFHTGDTVHIAQQALSHEREAQNSPPPLPDMTADHVGAIDPKKNPENPIQSPPLKSPPKSRGGSSGCLWLIILVSVLVGLVFGGIGLGAWGIYRWWMSRVPGQVATTPTPTATPTPKQRTQPVTRPTAKPTPRPQPTRTSKPKPTPTPTLTPRPQPTRTSKPKPTPTPTVTPQPTATPTPHPTATPILSPTPTSTPVHGLDPQAVNELQRILEGENASLPDRTASPDETDGTPSLDGASSPTVTPTVTPTPSITPTATATPTPEVVEDINPELLEELLRKGE